MSTHPYRSRRPRVATLPAVAASLMLLLGQGIAERLVAQRVEADTRGAPLRIRDMNPNSGPNGTRLTIGVDSLGPMNALRIGIGATGSGFEEVGQVLSDMDGRISLDLTVPQWPRPDRAYLVIVFDLYFRPLAFSDPFHVTGPNGIVERQGELTATGTSCVPFSDRDGFSYKLTGDTGDFRPGQEVIVEGTIADASVCRDPNTIQVTRIRPRRG